MLIYLVQNKNMLSQITFCTPIVYVPLVGAALSSILKIALLFAVYESRIDAMYASGLDL